GARRRSGGPDRQVQAYVRSRAGGRSRTDALVPLFLRDARTVRTFDCCDDAAADDRFGAGPAAMTDWSTVTDRAKGAGMAVLPFAVMVVGAKLAWPDVTWGTMLGG